jgi:hypothetical protein
MILDEFKKLNLIKIPDKHYTISTKHNQTMILQFGHEITVWNLDLKHILHVLITWTKSFAKTVIWITLQLTVKH